MKVQSKEGRSGFFRFGTEIDSDSASFAGGFCLIKAKGAASYFDTLKDAEITNGKALEAGMPIYIEAFSSQENNPLAEGDVVIPLEKKVSCWTTDCPSSMAEGEVDMTSQCDIILGKRDIQGDGNFTETGTINGYYDTESEMQRDLEGHFHHAIEHKGTGDSMKVTYVPRDNSENLWHWFTTREMTGVGEIETTLIREMHITQISASQPTSGAIPFSFNYSTMQSFNYRKEVTA